MYAGIYDRDRTMCNIIYGKKSYLYWNDHDHDYLI